MTLQLLFNIEVKGCTFKSEKIQFFTLLWRGAFGPISNDHLALYLESHDLNDHDLHFTFESQKKVIEPPNLIIWNLFSLKTVRFYLKN